MASQRTVAEALLADLAQEHLRLEATEESLRGLVEKAQPGLRHVADVAAALARKQAGALVADLTKAKQRRLRVVIARGLDLGWSDARLREEIASVVGLDDRYTEAVERYKAGLLNSGVTRGKANQAALSYAKRLLRARAASIAATETQTALLEAQRLMWTQQQEDGFLPTNAVRVWRVHKDERRCKVCRPMDGKRASLRAGSSYKGGMNPPTHPNCRCWEEVITVGLAKIDPDLLGEVVKHLPGAHDQGKHGKRGKRSFKQGASGFSPAIQEHLQKIRNGPNQAAASFAVAISRLGREFPEVAKNVRGVNVAPGATTQFKDGKADSPIAYCRTTNHGIFISMDPDEATAYARRAWSRVRSSEPPWGLPEAGVEAKDASFLSDIAEGIAVHEWGHAAHFHAAAVDYKAQGGPEDDTAVARVKYAMNDDFLLGPDAMPVLSTYAAGAYVESVAEWFVAWYYEMDEGSMEAPIRSWFEKAWKKPVVLDGSGIVKRLHEHILCRLDGSIIETWAVSRLRPARPAILQAAFDKRDGT